MEEARHDPALTDSRCLTLLADGVEIDTPRQLASLLGSDESLVWKHHEGQMDWCLCAIDLAKSLRGSGLTVQREGGRYLIERIAHQHV